MRLGTPSNLEPVDYIPGFRHASALCEDVALMVMCVGKNCEYLISEAAVREIAAIARDEGTGITVHLPCDHHFATQESTRLMVEDVTRAVERTSPLHPHTFVLHVDIPTLHADPEGMVAEPAGQTQAQLPAHVAAALQDIAALLPSPAFLAVENLEGFVPTFWDGLLAALPCSRCLDVGHLWKDGRDPGEVLPTWLDRTRVIHLHGLKARTKQPVPAAVHTQLPAPALQRELIARFGACPKDHKSLCHMPDEAVDTVMHSLWCSGWQGVLTLEVFATSDFYSSHETIMRSYERYLAAQER